MLLAKLWTVLAATAASVEENGTSPWIQGTPEWKSMGTMAFGPDGVLFVADPMAATIYAFPTNDENDEPADVAINADSIDAEIAALVGAAASDIRIHDVAVNPASGYAYLSVTRGQGNDAHHLIFYFNEMEELLEFSLEDVSFSKVTLPNAPASSPQARRDPRAESITDLAFSKGRLYIAGLSSEEFASNLRSIAFPFEEADAGASVEIYHGAHGRFETEAPVRTFAFYDIDRKPYMLAAYTCTPLVKIPIAQLEPGKKVKGITIAELGSGNRPLDMVVYEQQGKDFILLSNSRRGMMKIPTTGFGEAPEVTEHVSRGGTAGVPYDTIRDITGVVQMDRLNEGHVLVLKTNEDGLHDLRTIVLP